jgi:hypothetical protein
MSANSCLAIMRVSVASIYSANMYTSQVELMSANSCIAIMRV